MTCRPCPALLPCLAVLLALLGGCGEARRSGPTLFVLDSGSADTAVIDVATQSLVGFIDTGPKPHGIATTAANDLLFVANEAGPEGLVAVDPARCVVLAGYQGLGDRPGEIEATADGRFVYVPAKGDGVYRVFDTREEHVVATIPTDGQPHNVVVSPDDRFMYLASMDGGDIPVEKLVEAGLPTSENEKIYVVDAHSHQVLGTIDCGGTPRTIAIAPDGKRLYANLDDLLGFVALDLDARRLAARVEFELSDAERAVPSRSHGIVVTPDNRELWTVDVNHEALFVFDLTVDPPRQVARLATGKLPLWLAVTPDGRYVYLANTGEDSISAFEVATRKEVARIRLPAGKQPKRMLVLDVGRSVGG